jgi:hypothetical protein
MFAIKFLLIFLLINLINCLTVRPKPQNDLIQSLDKMAFNYMRVHYPFHKLKTNKTNESLTVHNVQKNNSSKPLPNFSNTISLTEYAQENGTFILKTVIKLVSFKLHSTKYNNSVVSVQKSDLMNLEEFVKYHIF